MSDSGQVCPITLTCDLNLIPRVRGVCPLQSAINHWHSSSPSPVLTAGTECIALQLNRFATEGRVIRKVAVAVEVFKGDTPKQGHYRALLIESSGRMLWTDDGRKRFLLLVATPRLFCVIPMFSSFVHHKRQSHQDLCEAACSLTHFLSSLV